MRGSEDFSRLLRAAGGAYAIVYLGRMRICLCPKLPFQLAALHPATSFPQLSCFIEGGAHFFDRPPVVPRDGGEREVQDRRDLPPFVPFRRRKHQNGKFLLL